MRSHYQGRPAVRAHTRADLNVSPRQIPLTDPPTHWRIALTWGAQARVSALQCLMRGPAAQWRHEPAPLQAIGTWWPGIPCGPRLCQATHHHGDLFPGEVSAGPFLPRRSRAVWLARVGLRPSDHFTAPLERTRVEGDSHRGPVEPDSTGPGRALRVLTWRATTFSERRT